jgi:hypothetical protein
MNRFRRIFRKEKRKKKELKKGENNKEKCIIKQGFREDFRRGVIKRIQIRQSDGPRRKVALDLGIGNWELGISDWSLELKIGIGL